MRRRFVSIWFPYLVADWMARKNSDLNSVPFILYSSERGRMIVKCVSRLAHAKGISEGMVVADCRAIFPDIQVFEYPKEKTEELLNALAIWCIRYTPLSAIDLPGGLMLDCSGCTHLWKGDESYLEHIVKRLETIGYYVRAAMSDTMATAWALSHYGERQTVVPYGDQMSAIMDLPPESMRLDSVITEKLQKLGLSTIRQFANISRPSLHKRFGKELLIRLDQASGYEVELFSPVQPPKLYQERLPCMEPISTARGIEIGIERLLHLLCERMTAEGVGLRSAILRSYRLDGNVQEVRIGTNLPTRNPEHLKKLFELKVGQLKPDLGFELFELEAIIVEPIEFDQTMIWNEKDIADTAAVAELLDKIISKRGQNVVHRYLPAEHYWPERSFQIAASIDVVKPTEWRTDMPRPIHLLKYPALIEVSVPIPDYPPMLFRFNNQIHSIKKADGPERIEQEWWIEKGEFRDYYCLEDEEGRRYWIFRSGHYEGGERQWFLHGFFA